MATDQDVFGLSKLLFDDTDLALHLAVGHGRHAACARAGATGSPRSSCGSPEEHATIVDRERMGVPLDPHAAGQHRPARAVRRRRSTIRTNVPFWWERGAQTAWQVVPLDDRHARPVRPLGQPSSSSRSSRSRDIAGRRPGRGTRTLAHGLRRMIDVRPAERGQHLHLPQPRTSCCRPRRTTGRGVLRRAVPRVAGDARRARDRVHDASRRTSRRRARSGPTATATGPGTGSMPRARAARRGGDPPSTRRSSPPPGSTARQRSATSTTRTRTSRPSASTRCVQAGDWTFGRRATGTSRCGPGGPPQWRDARPDPGLHPRADAAVRPRRRRRCRQRLDHRGRRPTTFSLVRAIPRRGRAAPIGVVDGRVRFDVPTEGEMTFAWTGPLTVAGTPIELHPDARMDNPFVTVPFGGRRYDDRMRRVRAGPRLRRLDAHRSPVERVVDVVAEFVCLLAVSVRDGCRSTTRTSTFFCPRCNPIRSCATAGRSAPAVSDTISTVSTASARSPSAARTRSPAPRRHRRRARRSRGHG